MGSPKAGGWLDTRARAIYSTPIRMLSDEFDSSTRMTSTSASACRVMPTHACESSVTIFLRVAAGRPARMTPITTERFEAWPSLNSLPLSASLNTTVTIDGEAPVAPLRIRAISAAIFSR